MKRKFTLLFFMTAFFAFSASAQLRVVDYDPVVNTDPDNNDAYRYVYIINDGQDDVELLWERNVQGLGQGAFTWICDNILCYLPTADKASDTKPNIIGNGDTMTVQIHLNPKGNVGTTTIDVNVYEKGSPGTNLAEISVEFMSAVSTSTFNLSKEAIKVYPNPTVDFFQVNYDEVANVSVYNIVGSKMLEFDAAPQKSYDVSALKEGIYLVRMTDVQNKVIKTVRLSKK